MRFLAAELLELIDDVVDELGSREEINYVHDHPREGHQLRPAVGSLSPLPGLKAPPIDEALKAVVDHLRAETMRGVRD